MASTAADVAAAKGKKSAAGASASAAGLKKGKGDRVRSLIKDTHLDNFHQEGLLPPKDQLTIRAPYPKEVFSEPCANERVCFAEFLARGFAFPIHDFVRGLMYAYGVQIHDFTPNGILHIAFFVTLL